MVEVITCKDELQCRKVLGKVFFYIKCVCNCIKVPRKKKNLCVQNKHKMTSVCVKHVTVAKPQALKLHWFVVGATLSYDIPIK